MLRTTVLSAVAAIALPLALSASAVAAPDSTGKLPKSPVVASAAQTNAAPFVQVADATRPKQAPMAAKDVILYNIISDQISEMRRKSALPTTMCIAESNGDGTAETVSRSLMAHLEADNAQVEDTFDRETHERAMLIVAGPMETEMKGLMTGCGDYVGGFVRASDDSDFDFYTVNGGDVARKLGCELAQ
jgi:hypothetical protein